MKFPQPLTRRGAGSDDSGEPTTLSNRDLSSKCHTDRKKAPVRELRSRARSPLVAHRGGRGRGLASLARGATVPAIFMAAASGRACRVTAHRCFEWVCLGF